MERGERVVILETHPAFDRWRSVAAVCEGEAELQLGAARVSVPVFRAEGEEGVYLLGGLQVRLAVTVRNAALLRLEHPTAARELGL